MVRYPAGHKERTREQIVSTAARAFREEGVAGVGIGEVMGRAGLTHGGFYAHFRSKDHLLAEACRCALDETTTRLMEPLRDAPREQKLAAWIRAYTSRTHRDDPGAGCLMPALAAEMPRQSPEVRAAFTATIQQAFARVESYLPETTPATDAEDRALALMAGLAGGVMLARAVDDPVLSDRILKACRTVFGEVFAAPADPPAGEAE